VLIPGRQDRERRPGYGADGAMCAREGQCRHPGLVDLTWHHCVSRATKTKRRWRRCAAPPGRLYSICAMPNTDPSRHQARDHRRIGDAPDWPRP